MLTPTLDGITSQLDGQVTSQLRRQLGETELATETGMRVGVAAILRGILQIVSSGGGASALGRRLNEGGYDGSLIERAREDLAGTAQLKSQGDPLLNWLYGNRVSQVSEAIATHCGMKRESAATMLATLAPLVMSYLGKQKQALGLDDAALARGLQSQQQEIEAALPPGATDAMGFTGMRGSHSDASSTPADEGSHTMLKVLIALAVIAAIGYGCYLYIFAGIRPPGAAGNIIVEPDPDAPEGYDPSGLPPGVAAGPGSSEPTEEAAPETEPVEPTEEAASETEPTEPTEEAAPETEPAEPDESPVEAE